MSAYNFEMFITINIKSVTLLKGLCDSNKMNTVLNLITKNNFNSVRYDIYCVSIAFLRNTHF